MCIGLVCIVLSIIVYRLSIWLYTSPSQVNSKRNLALDCIVVSWDHVEKVILSNDNTQYQVTRLNKQLWVTGLTLMTTETYASFFMCIINIHLDVHFLYYNCYGNCYSFFSKLSMLTDLTITVSIVLFLNSALTLSVCHLGFLLIFKIASISSSIASNIH